ncbi:hypothetical protein BC827DRAFT_909686 [Russula dissimulans]|nr:hypothetical protein BC827DRAFT_909686 [Russula dissimulans]
MSTSNQVASPPTDNFTAILNVAVTKYHTVTGKHLETHPLAAQLDTCQSPEAVSNILRTQALAFSQFRKADEKLMAWLDPTIYILFKFSATLGEGIGLPFSPAKTILTGIGVLLGAVRDVSASHDAVIRLFERIHFFLQRLNIYIGIPLTSDLTALLGNVMAHLLVILALSTKVMTNGRMKKILKRLIGKKDVEDALEKLDVLTKEEISMTVARNLQVAHDVDENVTAIKETIYTMDENLTAIRDVIGGVDSKVKLTEALTEVINANVKTTKALTEVVGNDVKVIDHNVRMAKDGMRLFSVHVDALTDCFFFPLCHKPATDELKRLLLSYTSILDRGVVAARVLEPSRSEIPSRLARPDSARFTGSSRAELTYINLPPPFFFLTSQYSLNRPDVIAMIGDR